MINLTEKESKKIKICTYICSILVVLIHTNNVKLYAINMNGGIGEKTNYFIQTFISHGIARIGVPLFFIISAFLFFYKMEPTVEWFSKKYRKRFRTLVIPYLFWNTVGYILFTIPQYIKVLRPFMNGYNNSPSIINFIESIAFYKYNTIFWFVFNQIILIVLSPIIYYLLKNKSIAKIVLLIVTALWTLGVEIPGGIMRLSAVVFFLAGAYIALHDDRIIEKLLDLGTDRKKAALLVIWVVMVSINVIRYNDYFYNINIILGIIAFWNGIDLVINSIQINKYMNYSFMIYALHPIILESIEKVIYKIGGVNKVFSIIDYMVAPIISLIIIYSICFYLETRVPKIYRIISDGRGKN